MTVARIYLETYGCAFNVSDSEAMAGVLTREGFALVDTPEQADVVILNTCTVKDRTYLNFEKRFRAARTAAASGGPALVVAGCIPRAYDRSALLEGVPALGPDTLERVGDVVREALAGRTVQLVRATREDRQAGRRAMLGGPRRNPAVEILPISSGCLSACTFCQTRLARGRLQSFRPGDLLERARRALAEGVTEIWVTSQDAGAYGKDTGYPLWRLLDHLCALEGDFRVRLGMTNPVWTWGDLTPTLDALEHPRMFKFLHVPIQSGSDAVLAAMKRGNTAAQFAAIAEAFHRRFPEGTLMTDVIVGYPSETDADFDATVALIEQTRPIAVNRSRFSPRPGTAAALLPPLPSATISQRLLRLNALVHRLAGAYHRAMVGQTGRVLTSEPKANGTTLAHNESYRPVVLQGAHARGRWLDVRYRGATDFHLKAEVSTANH